MSDAKSEAIVDAFVDAIAVLELDPARSTAARHEDVRYFVHPDGREGTPVTHEFFPHDVPAAEAIRFARSVAGDAPHMISPLGARDEAAAYAAAGYARTGAWTVMARPLETAFSLPGDERARAIADAATEERVLRAVLPGGGTGHPLRGGLASHPAVRQRWVEDGGEPAAVGRLVLVGAFSYLGDVATAPPYRRRGHAAAVTRRLLDDAREAGATTCVLATTAMAHGLYQAFGFAEVMPIEEFRSPGTED
jgi:ribosomal protein S18 acetylase RimI-like enzyme